MKLSLAWRLGWKAFRSPSSARLLISSSLAMALGLVPLVVVLSIADGMIDGISQRTIETALYHLQVWPLTRDAAERPSLAPEWIERVSKLNGYRGVWPEQRGFALAYSAGGTRLGVTLRGIDPTWPAHDVGISRYLKTISGTLTLADGEVWIGREAATKLGLQPGDELKLLTTRTIGGLTVPRVTAVKVAAIVSVGYQELDRLWLFAPLALTRTMLDGAEDPVFWGVKLDAPLDSTPTLLSQAKTLVGPGWQVLSWQNTGRSQFLNYQATRALLAVVMALVLLVAAVNVSTAMITTVAERRRETAILKALGASDRLVRAQFLVLGACAGLLGTVFGLALGMGLALSVNTMVAGADALVSLVTPGGSFHLLDSAYYLESIPVKFDPSALAAAAAGSVLLALAASWWPARTAARERPLEVLRRS